MMQKKPEAKKAVPAKARLEHLKPGEPGFLRPRVPSDPDFESFLKDQHFYPRFSEDTKHRLLRHLRHLDSPWDPQEEIDALERQAALAQYRYVHLAKRRLSVTEREKLARDTLDAADRFRTVLDKLLYSRLIADPNNVEAPLPDGSGVHVLRHSLRDLQAALDDLELQLASALAPDQPVICWEPDQSKSGNAENVARSGFIDTCIRVWLRNGGTDSLSYQAKISTKDGHGHVEAFESGLWPFVRDATKDALTTNSMPQISRGGLSKYLDRHMKRILGSLPEEAEWRGDPEMNEWGAKRMDVRLGAEKTPVKAAVAQSALRMVLNDLKMRWVAMIEPPAE